MKDVLDELTALARETPPLDEKAFYAHAYALYQAGGYREAADAFRVLSARCPLTSAYWFGLGSSLQQDGNYGEAMMAWAMNCLLDFDNPYPRFHAAECALSLGNIQDARKALAEAKERLGGAENHPLAGPIELLASRWNT